MSSLYNVPITPYTRLAWTQNTTLFEQQIQYKKMNTSSCHSSKPLPQKLTDLLDHPKLHSNFKTNSWLKLVLLLLKGVTYIVSHMTQ